MKTISLLVLVVLPLALFATDVKRGDSISDVQAELGAPRGQLVLGGRALYYYDRGEIEVRSGVVTRVALRSIAEQEAFENRRAAEASRVRDEQNIRNAKLTVEGEALKARKLADSAFLAAPLDYQVAFWEDFSRRFANVPCADNLRVARTQLAANVAEAQARADQSQRLAELEYRVAAAETQARESRSSDFFPVSYGSFSNRTEDYRGRYPYGRNQSTTLSYSYRLYDSPMPYATSPGMPQLQPIIRYESNPGSGSQAGGSMDDSSDLLSGSDKDQLRFSRGYSFDRRY